MPSIVEGWQYALLAIGAVAAVGYGIVFAVARALWHEHKKS